MGAMSNTTTIDCFAGIPPRRGYVHAGATRLSYLEWGDEGSPLLLLHGITSSARSWWRVAPALAAQGYHVYALDLPGHGESDETGDHRIANIAALVGAAMRALGLDRVTLIGHSWGGATTLALASSSDDRSLLARVALVDPALRMSPAAGDSRLPTFLEGVGQPPETTLPAIRAKNPDWHECDFFWKGEALQQCRSAAVRGVFLESGEWDLSASVAQVDVPLLLLVADTQYTVIAPDALAVAERALRPGLGRLAKIPDTTHNMHRGSGFDATMPVLMAWLAETRG
jgi:pimeloyl-ACP methyl ester carboxylesterase